MSTAAKILNTLAFAALFFDYAVAMQPPEDSGTRRMLQTYAREPILSAVPRPLYQSVALSS